MRWAMLCAVTGVALGGCGAKETLPAFNSPLERECYLQARDTLGAGQQLLRAGQSFALVTREQGFVRSTGRSAVFDSCMENGVAGEIASGNRPLSLTPQEIAVWDTLTDAQKKDAYQAILSGGTLAQYVATL